MTLTEFFKSPLFGRFAQLRAKPEEGRDVMAAETMEESARAGIELIISAIDEGKIRTVDLTPHEEAILLEAIAKADSALIRR